MSTENNSTNELFLPAGEILLVCAPKCELHSALKSLGVGTVMKNGNGEPFLQNSPYFISFTHKDDLAVAALSDGRVGVDIENVTIPRNVSRLSRLFHESETPESLYFFYKLWTAKEATGKYLGTGITSELLKKKTEGVRHLDYGDYIIAVAGEGEIHLKTY